MNFRRFFLVDESKWFRTFAAMTDDFTFPEKEVLKKLTRFCAYRDRSKSEVEQKLRALGVNADKAAKFITLLENENYLNQKRFVEAYINGKLHRNHWGKIKIIAGLRARHISGEDISAGIARIDTGDYYTILKKVLQSKAALLKVADDKLKRQKLIAYAASKGFTYDEIINCLKDME
jgi:regulatory protein